jgi:hypothetical protein
VAQVSVWVE